MKDCFVLDEIKVVAIAVAAFADNGVNKITLSVPDLRSETVVEVAEAVSVKFP